MNKNPIDRNEDFLNRIIAKRFKGSFMNDSKWVKLVGGLISESENILQCNVKLIWEDGPAYRELIIDSNKQFQFDYYEKAMEAMITGSPNGWYTYKEIEWLEFPAKTNQGDQNLNHISNKLNKIGKFELEQEPDKLRLYAYR